MIRILLIHFTWTTGTHLKVLIVIVLVMYLWDDSSRLGHEDAQEGTSEDYFRSQHSTSTCMQSIIHAPGKTMKTSDIEIERSQFMPQDDQRRSKIPNL